MNIKLRHNFELLGSVYYDDRLTLNSYYINLELITVSTNSEDLDIASKRIEWFIDNELADAVFINQDDHERAHILAMLGLNIVTLPGDPIDQMIGVMLACKINAILENRMIISEVSISSKFNNGAWLVHQQDDNIGPYNTDGWWHEPTVAHNSLLFEETTDNVVKVTRNPWIEYNLDWCRNPSNTTGSTVMFSKSLGTHEN